MATATAYPDGVWDPRTSRQRLSLSLLLSLLAHVLAIALLAGAFQPLDLPPLARPGQISPLQIALVELRPIAFDPPPETPVLAADLPTPEAPLPQKPLELKPTPPPPPASSTRLDPRLAARDLQPGAALNADPRPTPRQPTVLRRATSPSARSMRAPAWGARSRCDSRSDFRQEWKSALSCAHRWWFPIRCARRGHEWRFALRRWCCSMPRDESRDHALSGRCNVRPDGARGARWRPVHAGRDRRQAGTLLDDTGFHLHHAAAATAALEAFYPSERERPTPSSACGSRARRCRRRASAS